MKFSRLIYILLFCMCYSFTNVKGQYVTIPDSNFVNWLNSNGFSSCMNGNLMDTTCSLVTSRKHIGIINTLTFNIDGIQYFDSLISLSCYNNQLISLPPLPASLTKLWCNANQIDVLPELPGSLLELNCGGNPITSLPTLPPLIKSLFASELLITDLPELPDSLETLAVNNCQLTSLPTLPGKLKILQCSYNLLDSLPELPSEIYVINCYGNPLTKLPELPASLNYLSCGYCQIDTLPDLANSTLQELYCQSNNLTFLPQLPSSLNTLNCYGNSITHITNLPDLLTNIDISFNPIACLPPTHTFYQSFSWYGTSIQCLPNVVIAVSDIPDLDTIPTCDPINLNNCPVNWNIQGSTFFDANINCNKDSMETGRSRVKVELINAGNVLAYTYSNSFGRYSLKADTGIYEIKVDTSTTPYFVSCPTSSEHTVFLTAGNMNVNNIDFAIECKAGFDVGTLSIIPFGGMFRPGTNTFVKVVAGDMGDFHNLNCASGIAGSVTIHFTGPISYVSPAVGSLIPIVSGDSLYYIISDFGSINMQSDFVIDFVTDTLAQVGEVISFTAIVEPMQGDVASSNNIYSQYFEVVNSCDPNDKKVSPIGIIDTTQEWLTYTIRFQNTGNAPAQHIYILDTLDLNIDAGSFQLLSYSHESVVQITDNIMKFSFPGINLPDSVSDEPNSHGYVQYKVKLNENLPLGTEIQNTAYIYFDFNPPVQTNAVSNTIDVITSVSGITSQSTLHIYPNPVKSGGVLNLVSKEKLNGRLSLVDIMGRFVYSSKAVQLPGPIVLPSLTSGIYQIMVETTNGNLNSRIVVH